MKNINKIKVEREVTQMASTASPEAIERMIRNIVKCVEAQQSVANSLKRDYALVGLEWNDKQYLALGTVIDQAVVDLYANQTSLSECVTRLQVLKRVLEEYLATQI